MNETGRRDVRLFSGGSRDGVEEVASLFGHFDLFLKFVSFASIISKLTGIITSRDQTS